MEAFWWLFAIVLMALGLIGTVIPIVPGTTIILAAAVVHRLMLGADRSLGMSALLAMLVLTLVTYAIDAAAGYVGAKRFGATKWGLIGGVAGAVIGLFFGLFGLFVGPVIGAIAGEMKGRPSCCAFRQTKNVFSASRMASAPSQSEAKLRVEIWRITSGARSAQ